MNGGWSLFSQLPEKNEVLDQRMAALEAVLPAAITPVARAVTSLCLIPFI